MKNSSCPSVESRFDCRGLGASQPAFSVHLRGETMFTSTKWLLPAAALAMVSGTADARPLLLSDLPPELWSLPSAQADLADPPAHVSGIASWYGHDHAGRRMSNGARFDPRALTAAHATIPLGTQVKVVREDTGAS